MTKRKPSEITPLLHPNQQQTKYKEEHDDRHSGGCGLCCIIGKLCLPCIKCGACAAWCLCGSGATGQQKDMPTLSTQISRAMPYIWPSGNPKLKLRIVISLAILVLVRVINLFTPISLKHSVDEVTRLEFPLFWATTYCVLRILSSFGKDLRSLVWLDVSLYTTRTISTAVFAHLHSLSMSYHLTRKTGEVLKVIDRGTTGLSSLLEMFLANILPMLGDLLMTCIYFIVSPLSFWYMVIIVLSLVLYMFLTFRLTSWRQKYRREMNEKTDRVSTAAIDSLLNFETVKYFSAEKKETERYRGYVVDLQSTNIKVRRSLVLLNLMQNLSINLGMLGIMLLAGVQAANGTITPGDFVMINAYLVQLQAPLSWLGTAYTQITQSMVDCEKLFKVLEINANIVDKPGAGELVVTHGAVEFKDVSFWYDERQQILKHVSFKVPPGKKLAVVGQTGSGKSTLGRLLYRLYDVQEGSVLVDGQNVKDVTQYSLRKAIGIVPQDTVLFNNTIEFNIAYGSVDRIVPPEHVEHASRVAQIYDKIAHFPDKFSTMVGERGLRLSGGEKQRVAIARTVLKNPKLLLLDEATSALDSATERQIQHELDELCRDRTTIVIAHRLSTVVDADEILVMHEGEIAERGRHAELLSQEGMYATLWRAQQEKEEEDGA
eukprot:TRINITY_DN103453_c0_g1_i1.p1 TRINITY_DN103453_c0_g1~~TRINITY_DN103453_c0_g1_i1.p1  ORF type:complete len:659 (+),score=78.75 TRINITY_DN103453_c0_g1_i1:46-2022(+)